MPSPSKSPRHLYPFISRQNPILFLLEASSCNTFAKIKQAHALLLTSGLFLHPFPPSKLLQVQLSLPSSPPLLSYAHLLFHHSPSPPLFSYNSLIKAHSNTFSLRLFRSLLRDSSAPLPNQYTITFALAACRPGSGLELGEAEQVRGHAVRRGFETNLFVSNVLIKMYGSWGLAADAEKFFDECSHRDLFSWNLMVGVYVGSGDAEGARKVFDEMPDRDVVSWSTMIAGYVQDSYISIGIRARWPRTVGGWFSAVDSDNSPDALWVTHNCLGRRTEELKADLNRFYDEVLKELRNITICLYRIVPNRNVAVARQEIETERLHQRGSQVIEASNSIDEMDRCMNFEISDSDEGIPNHHRWRPKEVIRSHNEFQVKLDMPYFDGKLHIEDYLDWERSVETFLSIWKLI